MFLELTDDQRLFQETTARFIETESPITKVREWHDSAAGFEREWLQKSAELGWFSMLVPESIGGGSISGNGLMDASIASIEIGRNVQPGPFVPMNTVVAALANYGSPQQQETIMWSVVGGESIATWAWADSEGNRDMGRGLRAVAKGDSFVLNGVRGLVQDAQSADLLLVVAEVDGAIAQFILPTSTTGVAVTPLQSLDLSKRFAEVTFDNVVVPAESLVGEIGDVQQFEHLWRIAVALLSAETVGVIDWLFTTTVEYSKARTAFGRPIGSYQSLKHIMADLGMYVEMAKATAVSCVEAVQANGAEAGDVAAMTAAFVGDTAINVSQEALQIHGGIGYTWEHDLHLFLRRARSNSLIFGNPTWHREHLVAMHGL